MSNKILPKNTEISKYFCYEDKIFEKLTLPDERVLVSIVHTWGNGEIMGADWGFQYKDGILRRGLNPLHIVKIYYTNPTDEEFNSDIKMFLKMYNKKFSEQCSCG